MTQGNGDGANGDGALADRTPRVIIIGAGATGMLAYIRLKEAGITDLTIFEKSDTVGGTWRENTYPGIACDIPAPHYCYSFEPYVWQHHLAHGAELQAYMEHVGQTYGVTPNVRFGEAVVSCVFDEAANLWRVETDQGTQAEADFVISATGILHHPKWPEIAGQDRFAGETWHSAQWRHEVELTGKRIGVIGTGSTAHQFVPELINAGHDVTVFQRTAQWVAPVPNIRFPEWLRARWRAKPARMRGWKTAYRWLVEGLFIKATVGRPVQRWVMTALCKAHLWHVRDRQLRARLRPDYAVGCKRLVINTTFYPAIQKPNARLVTEDIRAIEPKGIRTGDDLLHDLDVLIYATGFHNFNYMRPMDLQGLGGRSIEDTWPGGTYPTYRGLMMPNFPNFVLMLGPGTPIGNNTIIGIAERQMDYVLQLIDLWRQGRADRIAPTPQAVAGFSDYIRKGMEGTVWTGGCTSWYMDATGTPTIFPYDWAEFLRSMDAPVLEHFDLGTAPKFELGKGAA